MKSTKTILFLLIFISTTAFISCKTTFKTTASWVNKEKIKPPYKSVFIVVLTENLAVKTVLENDLAEAARAKGLIVYKSSDEFGPVASFQSAPVKEAFLKKVRDEGCETIFAVALVDSKSDTKYVQGTTPYIPYSYAGYGGGYGMYGGFGGYYGYSL